MGIRGLSRIAAVAANTFRETVRERVLYNLVFFALMMTVLGLVLGDLSVRQDEKILKDLGLASMELFGTIIAVFIGVGLVSKEIERRSLYPLLAKPLSRDEFLVGKYLGLAFTLLVNMAVMALGLFATLLITHRRADPQLLKAVLATYLGLLLIVAFAVMFSTFTSSTLALTATIGVVLAGRYSDVVRNMREVTPEAPSFLVHTLYYALPNLRNFDVKNAVVYGDPVSFLHLGWIALYGAAYVGVALSVAAARFRRRDFL